MLKIISKEKRILHITKYLVILPNLIKINKGQKSVLSFQKLCNLYKKVTYHDLMSLQMIRDTLKQNPESVSESF